MQLGSPNSAAVSDSSMAAMAAAYKYNSLYSNMQQHNQQQSQQLQQSYLAKYMSFCYNKPVDYIQRLLVDQAAGNGQQQAASASFADSNLFLLAEAEKFAANFTNQKQMHASQLQKPANLRYHPYKNSTGSKQQQPISISTNSHHTNSGSELSPSLSVTANSPTYSSAECETHSKKQASKQAKSMLVSRSPSPASSTLSSPVQKMSGVVGKSETSTKK